MPSSLEVGIHAVTVRTVDMIQSVQVTTSSRRRYIHPLYYRYPDGTNMQMLGSMFKSIRSGKHFSGNEGLPEGSLHDNFARLWAGSMPWGMKGCCNPAWMTETGYWRHYRGIYKYQWSLLTTKMAWIYGHILYNVWIWRMASLRVQRAWCSYCRPSELSLSVNILIELVSEYLFNDKVPAKSVYFTQRWERQANQIDWYYGPTVSFHSVFCLMEIQRKTELADDGTSCRVPNCVWSWKCLSSYVKLLAKKHAGCSIPCFTLEGVPANSLQFGSFKKVQMRSWVEPVIWMALRCTGKWLTRLKIDLWILCWNACAGLFNALMCRDKSRRLALLLVCGVSGTDLRFGCQLRTKLAWRLILILQFQLNMEMF